MLRILLGILLMGASFVLLFMFIGDPADNSLVQQVQTSLHCQPDETFIQVMGRYVDNFGTSTDGYEFNFYCEGKDGERRDVTGPGVLTIGAGFVVPFVGGLLLMLWGIFAMVWKATRKLTSAAFGAAADGSGFGTANQPAMIYTNQSGQPIRTSATFVNASGQPVDVSQIPPEKMEKIQDVFKTFGMNLPQTGSAGTDLIARLQQLEEARSKNLITQEEYDRLRKEILDRLT